MTSTVTEAPIRSEVLHELQRRRLRTSLARRELEDPVDVMRPGALPARPVTPSA